MYTKFGNGHKDEPSTGNMVFWFRDMKFSLKCQRGAMERVRERKERERKRWRTTKASPTARVLTGNQEVCPMCHHTCSQIFTALRYFCFR